MVLLLTISREKGRLSDMTDREITFMLEQLPDKEALDKSRRSRPTLSDRVRAEFLRDFG